MKSRASCRLFGHIYINRDKALHFSLDNVDLSWPFTTSSLAIYNKCRNYTPLGNQRVETMGRVVVCDSRYAQWKLPMLHSVATGIQLSEAVEKFSALVAQFIAWLLGWKERHCEGDSEGFSKVMNQGLHGHI